MIETELSPGDIAENEERRLARRKEIREQIATARALYEKANGLQRLINELDGELDLAADRHSAVCEPLQTELQTTTDNARRKEILQEIITENARLESAVTAVKAAKRKVSEQIAAAHKAALPGVDVLHSQLVRLAPLEQQLKSYAIGQRIRWLVSRQSAVREQIEKNQSWRERAERHREVAAAKTYAARIAQHQADLADAAELIESARAEETELRRLMIEVDQ